MHRNELSVPNEAYELAETSTDQELLERLSKSHSHFVRGAVARNTNIGAQTHSRLLKDERRGVQAWALTHSLTSREAFEEIFARYIQQPYCSIMHPTLAGHHHVHISELITLLERKKWLITMEVLNNTSHFETKAFKEMVKPLTALREAEPGSDDRIVGRLAFKRVHGHYPYHA